MAFIKIEKSELAELEKKCKEQERQIHEQDELIEKLSFAVDVFDGWKIRLTKKFLAVELQNIELLIQRIESLKVPDGAATEVIAHHKTILKELQQDREKACKKCDDIENAWEMYTKTFPAAAKALMSRVDAELIKKGGIFF
jgi:DNA-binding GntR family transcriptional regulator